MQDDRKVETLPVADAIVNMKREEDNYPFKKICGALTALKLIELMIGSKHEAMEELIAYAAIATVCDVMPLEDENRDYVKMGLEIMSNRPPLGILALKRAYEIEKVSAYHLGFVLGPCLNSSGRLDSAELALDMLTCNNLEKACQGAIKLKEINDIRKELTNSGVEEALTKIEANKEEIDKIVVIYLENCHESIAGIIAGKVKETLHRPTIVFTRAEQGVKASARSVECYDMFEELSKVKHLFTKFGGHKMAAGLSMDSVDKIDILRNELNNICDLKEEDFREKVYIDAAVYMSHLTLEHAKDLENLEPFGIANQKPLFAEKDMLLIGGKKLGTKGTAMKCTLKSSNGTIHEAIMFGNLTYFHTFLDNQNGKGASEKLYNSKCEFPINVLYQIQVNVFNGRESLQILLKHYC